jgi:hypothetical protein
MHKFKATYFNAKNEIAFTEMLICENEIDANKQAMALTIRRANLSSFQIIAV